MKKWTYSNKFATRNFTIKRETCNSLKVNLFDKTHLERKKKKKEELDQLFENVKYPLFLIFFSFILIEIPRKNNVIVILKIFYVEKKIVMATFFFPPVLYFNEHFLILYSSKGGEKYYHKIPWQIKNTFAVHLYL